MVLLTSVLEATYYAAVQLAQEGLEAARKMMGMPTMTKSSGDAKHRIRVAPDSMNAAVEEMNG